MGWAVLSPLSKLSGWAPGPVGDMSNGARGWILWTSLGIMCADSVVSLIPVIADYVNDLLSKRKDYSAVDDVNFITYETETEDRLVPMSWVLTGVTASVIAGTILVWVVFGHDGIKPWATILGFVLGSMLSIIGYVSSMSFSLVYLCRFKSSRSRRNRLESSFWFRQGLPVILCLDTTWEYCRKHYRRRSCGGGRTTVSSFFT